MPSFAIFKAKWFWYSTLCVLSWGVWALLSKVGSNEIPADTMQFLFTFGALPVALILLMGRRFKLEKSPRGIFYAVANGVLSGIGGLAFFAAFRSGGNTAVIASATSLYPMITVALAVTILRERLTWVQVLGLGFAAAAIVIFSFSV
jgi:transporter family protein